MLRSLDPKADFEKPKSRRMIPTDGERDKFSKGELESIDRAVKRTDELTVKRAVRAKQENVIRDLVLEELAGKNGKKKES